MLKFASAIFDFHEGTLYAKGYTHIYHEDNWCLIYYYWFNDKQANVVCQTGGYSGGKYVTHQKLNEYPENVQRCWLYYLQCGGNEHRVTECKVVTWKDKGYGISDDVELICFF